MHGTCAAQNSELRISFVIPGHTKLAPDLLFSKLASAYYKSDVFNENDLQLTAYVVAVVDHGMIVCTWQERVGEKYSKLHGIQALHDFLSVSKSPSGVLMKVGEIYAGALKDTPTKVKKGFGGYCIPRVTETY